MAHQTTMEFIRPQPMEAKTTCSTFGGPCDGLSFDIKDSATVIKLHSTPLFHKAKPEEHLYRRSLVTKTVFVHQP